MLQLLKPKIRPDSAITQIEAGGLSVVMKLEESSEPKKNAFDLGSGLDRGGVEAVGVARGAQVPHIRERGQRQQREHGRTNPALLGRLLAAMAQRAHRKLGQM
jgi:hypothetical protein